MCGFTLSCACAMSHLDLCSPLIHSIISKYSDSGKRKPCFSFGPSLSEHAPRALFCLARFKMKEVCKSV